MTLKKRTKKKLANQCTIWAMFFLPFGYDALFKFVMDFTGEYWVADRLFYCIFFVLIAGRFYFLEQNPITELIKMHKRNVRRLKKLKSKMPWLFKKKRRQNTKTSQKQSSI